MSEARSARSPQAELDPAAKPPVTGGRQPLVGRESELGLMAESLDALAREPRGQMLQIAGEPGIGKSRLLQELHDAAQDRGYLVLSGRAAEFEGELPFGVFGDALDDWLLSLAPARLEELAGDQAARWQSSSRPSSGSPSGGFRSFSRSATGPTARSAGCSARWPPRLPSCSCSTTCSGPTPAQSS